MVIRTLVLPGGAYRGFYYLGILRALETHKYYKRKNIKNIYAMSVGTIIAVLLCLKIPWDDLYYYLENKAWEKTLNISPDLFVHAYQKKGFLTPNFLKEIMHNLILFKNFNPETLTLKMLHEFSKKTLHLYAMQLNSFTLIKFTHVTHPDMKVVDALYQCCAIPFVFQPVWREGDYYVDAHLCCSFPMKMCLEDGQPTKHVLGICPKTNGTYEILPEDNIFSMGYKIFRKLIKCNAAQYKWDPKEHEGALPQVLYFNVKPLSGHEAMETLRDKNKRMNFIGDGAEAVEEWIGGNAGGKLQSLQPL